MDTSEIEFKAKNSDGEWVHGCYAEYKVFGEEVRRVIIDRKGRSETIDPATLCEYTRIRDMCGKKIFVNDRAEMYVVNTTYYRRPTEEKLTGNVRRDTNGEFYFAVSGTGEKYTLNSTIVVSDSEFDEVGLVE